MNEQSDFDVLQYVRSNLNDECELAKMIDKYNTAPDLGPVDLDRPDFAIVSPKTFNNLEKMFNRPITDMRKYKGTGNRKQRRAQKAQNRRVK